MRPHYDTAKRMLGVTENPRMSPADETLKAVADEIQKGDTFRRTEVSVFFNEEKPGEPVPDPYFGGKGPERCECTHCGACMVGCHDNGKNTLVKHYLYFAEEWGAVVQPEATVKDVQPLPDGQPDGARYEVVYSRTTSWGIRSLDRIRARNVILSAGAVNTNRMLSRWRDVTKSLPKLSGRLGYNVRTNSESLTGAIFLGVFFNYQRLIPAHYQIIYTEYGISVIKALILAKVVLVAETLRLGRGFEDKPLVVPTLYKTFLFSVCMALFGVAEDLVRGLIGGLGPMGAVHQVISGFNYEWLAKALVVFFVFIPFFMVRELGRVLGEGVICKLFFQRRPATKADCDPH